jgi:hypothetical protein
MTTHEAREPHVSIPAAELDRLRAELAECRRLLFEHEFDEDRHLCPECREYWNHAPDCAWQKAMGEQ